MINKKNKQIISNFLINGKYIYNNSFDKLFIRDNSISNTFSEQYFSKKEKIINQLKKIVYRKGYNIQTDNKEFNGYEMVMPSSNYGYKFFNNKEVLTFYFDSNEMYKILKSKEVIKKMYKVPNDRIVNKNYFIEERINGKKYNLEEFIDYILLAENKKEHSQVDSSYLEKKYSSVYNYKIIHDFFKKYLKKTNMIISIQHNDLWSGNVLFDDEFYVIDYENVNEQFFLYDFFTFIYSDYYINKNIDLIKKYLNGNYNDKFLSKINCVQFNCNKLKDYFLIFLYISFLDRFGYKKRKALLKEFKNVSKVISDLDLGC